MKYLLLLSTIISIAFAGNTETRALDNVKQALERVPAVQKISRRAEKLVYKHTILTKERAKYIGYLVPIAEQKINTSQLKSLGIKGKNYDFRPDISYDFRQEVFTTEIKFNLRFD